MFLGRRPEGNAEHSRECDVHCESHLDSIRSYSYILQGPGILYTVGNPEDVAKDTNFTIWACRL